jgi:uncharacterized DUF497 family protein
MRFEWDEAKSRFNRKKHGISFQTAAEVFADPFCMTIEDRDVAGEQRFWTLGRLENLVVLVVAHTTRNQGGEEAIRIISARKATPQERRHYEETHD